MTTIAFATVVRDIGIIIRPLGLRVPGYRSPPVTPGAARTIRRTESGGVVAVVLRDRTDDEVITDMVEGALVLNDRMDLRTRVLVEVWRAHPRVPA